MSVPQQLPVQSAAAFQPQYPSALKGGGSVATTHVKFDIRDVTKHRVSNFLLALNPQQTKDLAIATCKASKDLQGSEWSKSNLVKDLKKHDLPRDFSHRSGCSEDKHSAVLNLFKGVQEEAINAKEGDALARAENLKKFLQDPSNVFVGGQTVFFQKMEQYEAELPPPVSGSPTQGSQGVKEPSLPIAVNPAFDMQGKPLPSLGDMPAIIASAPPNYDTVQAEQTASRLVDLNIEISNLQQGQANDFQTQPFQSGMRWVETEIAQIGFNLPAYLQGQYGEAKANFDSLQQQQQHLNETVLVEQYHSKIDELEKLLVEKQPKQENSRDVNAIGRNVNGLASQVEKLGSVESQKAELKDRVKELETRVSEWKTRVAALDTIKSMKSDLDAFKFQKSPKDVHSFSTRLDELDETIRMIPSGDGRNELMRESGILRSSFSDIQQNVKQQQLKDELEKAEKKIKALEQEASGNNPKTYLVEQVRSELDIATPLVVEGGREDDLARLGSLRGRLEKFDSPAGAGHTTAPKMQSASQGQVGIVASIDDLIAEADNRLSGAEKIRIAVAGAPLNQTHMDEIQGILDQVSEKILQVKGSDYRAERDRLQTMNATLLSRWTELRAGGANNGQSTAATAHPVTGNQNQTAVDDIRTALSAAEAPIDALTSNPNSPNKNDLHTQAKGYIEKATLMLGKLTNAEFKPERAGLNAKLTNLTARLEALELSANQGQRLNKVNASQLQRQHQESELEQAGAVVGQSLEHYQGRVSEEATRNTLGSLSGVLSKLAERHNPVSGHVPVHSPGKHSVTQPVVASSSTLAPKPSLTALAASLKLQQSDFYKDQFVAASIGVEPSKTTGKIIPVQVSAEVPFLKLPEQLQYRMTQACNGRQPEKIVFTQVTLIADDKNVFNGASLRIALNTVIDSKYGQNFKSFAGRGYSPIVTCVSLPKNLEADSSFYPTHWSAHEKGVDKDQSFFAFEKGSRGYKHDIGFVQLAGIIKAAGGSDELASSDEAGMLIPYGVQVNRQSNDVLGQIGRPARMRSMFDGSSDVADGPSDVMTDGLSEVTDGPSASGIVPIAQEKETPYTTSRCTPATEVLVNKPGILLIRTATGMDMKSDEALKEWIYGKTLDPNDLNKISVL